MKYKIRYTEKSKQNTYMNACDCLRYGYTFRCLVSCGDFTESEKMEIWMQAKKDLSSL
jgi:hypothetical protein